jgi:hypothetical protein
VGKKKVCRQVSKLSLGKVGKSSGVERKEETEEGGRQRCLLGKV